VSRSSPKNRLLQNINDNKNFITIKVTTVFTMTSLFELINRTNQQNLAFLQNYSAVSFWKLQVCCFGPWITLFRFCFVGVSVVWIKSLKMFMIKIIAMNSLVHVPYSRVYLYNTSEIFIQVQIMPSIWSYTRLSTFSDRPECPWTCCQSKIESCNQTAVSKVSFFPKHWSSSAGKAHTRKPSQIECCKANVCWML